MTTQTNLSIAAAFMLAAACVSSEPKTAEDSAAAAVQQVDSAQSSARSDLIPKGESASVTPGAPSPAATPEPRAGEWQVTPQGIGTLRAGMTLDEANIILHNKLAIPASTGECSIVKMNGEPKGLTLMVENGIVTRVDVTGPAIATVEGAKIGDSEEKVKSLYPGQVGVEPHKYTNGHYLVVTPKSGGDYRIIFETDGSKVTRFRSGKLPSVAYVESCS